MQVAEGLGIGTRTSGGVAWPGVWGEAAAMAAAAATGTAAVAADVVAATHHGGSGGDGGGGCCPELYGLRASGGVEDAGAGPATFHSVHFDANFKLNSWRWKRYEVTYKQLQQRRYFISNLGVHAALGDAAASAKIGSNSTCSNFTADKVLAVESKQDLVTALGVALCRHGVLLRLLNLFTGERHAYSTAAVQSLLAVGTGVQYWWYDIACRWGKSYAKWLQHQSADVRQLGGGMTCLLPPWHRFAHSYECQRSFGHTHIPGAGRGTGEPAEIWNSIVGPHGAVTRYMSPANRECHIERVGRHYDREVRVGLPHKMWRAGVRAKAELDSTNARIGPLERSLVTPLGVTNTTEVRARVQHQLEVEREHRRQQQRAGGPVSAGPRAGSTTCWQPEYARCRLTVERLDRADPAEHAGEVPLGLLLPGADTATVRQRPSLLRSLRQRQVELETEHSSEMPQPWALDSTEFRAATGALVEGEVKKTCTELEALVLDWYSLELVVNHLRGRKREQELAIKEKRKVHGRLKQLWQELLSWCKAEALPEGLQPLATAVQQHDAFERAKQRHFPWEQAGLGEQQGAIGGAPKAMVLLMRSYEKRARCEEELGLLSLEAQRAVAYYKWRVQALEANRARHAAIDVHLRHCKMMLQAFEGLARGEVPADRSKLPAFHGEP